MYVHGVSGVTAYKLDHSLRKLKLAEDCFHRDQKRGWRLLEKGEVG